MPTEQQGETREDIAKALVMKVKELLYSTSLTKQDWQMIRTIEAALKDRDERAVRIIREHRESDVCKDNCWTTISAAIRNEE